MSEKYIYYFGKDSADGSAEMKNLLGGKGANLAEMSNLGMPVPPGFTLTTEVCTFYYSNECQYPSVLNDELEENLRKMEEELGSDFGNPNNPLLLSVRSGARASMPGMMETILNVGLNDETRKGLIEKNNTV